MGRGGTRVMLPYVHTFKDRHGHTRRYFRRRGCPQIALPGRPGSPEFQTAYHAALTGYVVARSAHAAVAGSLSATIAAYYTDNSFLALAPTTRQARRSILERFRSEYGEQPISRLEQKHVAILLGKMKPFAARNWLKTLRGLMLFAVAIGLRANDPTEKIVPAKGRAGTIHTWSEDEIAIFEHYHALGTKPRLAMALLLYTAARRGDAVTFGRQHTRGGSLTYRQSKTGRSISIPIHPVLARTLALSPGIASQNLTFLATASGRPYTPKAFGNLMRQWCNEAGLPQCSSHGLRKAQARRLAEAGCSANEIASITGHKTLSEVQRYTAAAEQSRLASAAMGRTMNSVGNPPEMSGNPPQKIRDETA